MIDKKAVLDQISGELEDIVGQTRETFLKLDYMDIEETSEDREYQTKKQAIIQVLLSQFKLKFDHCYF